MLNAAVIAATELTTVSIIHACPKNMVVAGLMRARIADVVDVLTEMSDDC